MALALLPGEEPSRAKDCLMTLRIQRSTDDGGVIFSLSGRIVAEQVAELRCLFTGEAKDRRIVLDLSDVDLVDRDTVQFLAQCAEDGINLQRCPAYIREWIFRERGAQG